MRVKPQGVRINAAIQSDRNDKGCNIGTQCQGHWVMQMQGGPGREKKLGQGKTMVKRKIVTQKQTTQQQMVTAKSGEDALQSVMMGILRTCYSSEARSDKSEYSCYFQ